jgi:hypothetical protein
MILARGGPNRIPLNYSIRRGFAFFDWHTHPSGVSIGRFSAGDLGVFTSKTFGGGGFFIGGFMSDTGGLWLASELEVYRGFVCKGGVAIEEAVYAGLRYP